MPPLGKRPCGQALRRRDYRCTTRHRLENLVLHAQAKSQRTGINGRAADPWSNIGDRACDLDSGNARQVSNSRGWISSDDPECRLGNPASDRRHQIARKVFGRVLIWRPAHVASEDDSARLWRRPIGKILEVNAVGYYG